MPLFKLLSLLFLTFAFAVLVWTFVWVARLLARRAASAEDRGGRPAEVDLARAEAAAEEEQRRRTGTGVNATVGLILGVLACALFLLSPYALAVSTAGIYFSAGALWAGLRRFRIFLFRALVGLALSLASIGLHYGFVATGGLSYIL